ncbi:Late expression factor 12 [Perigonia lusca single nucleopolyhedrovirus]|uniref:Late expression factor 12 n=1 Tax=Perigonia lusca single nucleopolyhedrovirus TaxID=1675865 RepID=A0A0M3WND6_9ABAC|nr:Late expression factor 12 [Perigonia lusca single nucleopolyhedrovirus]AKN80568.1 Late expression factor 12 [Perigonia lusca single nucleopolyhedrovirus]
MNAATIINVPEYHKRLNKIIIMVKFVKDTVDQWVEKGLLSENEAKSLHVAEDTAAFICGRTKTANFVSFRLLVSTLPDKQFETIVQSYNFIRYVFDMNGVVDKVDDVKDINEETREYNQNCLEYFNFMFPNVAIRLVIVQENYVNVLLKLCPRRFSYSIKICDILRSPKHSFVVTTNDCECVWQDDNVDDDDDERQCKLAIYKLWVYKDLLNFDNSSSVDIVRVSCACLSSCHRSQNEE